MTLSKLRNHVYELCWPADLAGRSRGHNGRQALPIGAVGSGFAQSSGAVLFASLVEPITLAGMRSGIAGMSELNPNHMNCKSILLVEDNPDDELLVVRALRKNQIWNDVEVVRDGVAALDFLFATGPCCGRDPGHLPAVVLLDLRLPRMHGFQVLRRIRAERRTQDLPVIIITASWEVEDILSGYSLRADGYVCKSVNFEKFVNALGHLGLEGLLADEPGPARVRASKKASQDSGAEATPIHLGLND